MHGLCNLGLFARATCARFFYFYFLERVCETLVTTFAARLAAGPDISSESSLARSAAEAVLFRCLALTEKLRNKDSL